jgi:hypothetical protein
VYFPYGFKKQFKKNKMYSGEINMKLSDEGVYINHSIGDALLKWNAFSHYQCSVKCCVLFTTPNCVHIIPLRIFDEEEFKGLKPFLTD